MQTVSGIEKVAYFGSFLLFDLVASYIPCLLTTPILEQFNLYYTQGWKTFLLYPLSVIPFTYATAFMYNIETTAQTWTIYLHFLFSSIACMIVFALRRVEATALAGDRAMWVMRFVCPTFNVCNTIIFGGCKDILAR